MKNILVIRPDAIGDTVLTLPAIQALKDKFPDASITVLCRPYTEPLLSIFPAVDRVIYDYELKKYNFDLSINYFNQFKDTFAAFKAGIPARIGDSSRILTGWMNTIRVFRNWNDFTRHEVEFNFDLLKPLGISMSNHKPRLLLAKAATTLGLKAGIHIGASTSQAWTASGFAKLADWLINQKGARVYLLGGEKELEKANQITAQIKGPIINLAGKNDLLKLIKTISQLDYFVGMDSGPTHLAALFDIPLVMLCLNKKAKPLRWGPWQTRHLVVTGDKNLSHEKVISALDIVMNNGGVTTRQEALVHWAQQSHCW